MPELSHLSAVRRSYDTVASAYVERVPTPDAMAPLERAMLAAFAELVLSADRGPVADLGCGPGRLTAHLAKHGLSAFGIDLSPKMIELARQAFPDLRFTVGSITALDLPDNSLGGILAWYSTYHTPPKYVPVVFGELHRTLAPGGHLLLGVYVGEDEHLRPARAYGGHPVSYQSYLLPLDRIVDLLEEAGLVVTARLIQGPDDQASRPYVSILARKPEQP
jgi:SAM-dependent methyltransferase